MHMNTSSCRSEEYVLLQPKFVLPEFFMHVQFPLQVSRSAESTGDGSKSTRAAAPPSGVLTLPPGAAQPGQARGKKPSADSLFPLENLFLQNAAHHLEVEARAAEGQRTISYEEEGEEIDGSADDLHETLMRKQVIVQGLQQAVQDFRREKDALVLAHVRNLAKKAH